MEAQFQTALDMLIETHSGEHKSKADNADTVDGMNYAEAITKHDPEDPNYCDDSMGHHTALPMSDSHDTDCSGSSQLCHTWPNTANHQQTHRMQHSFRR